MMGGGDLMKHYTYESRYGTYEDCYFELGRYCKGGNLAIQLFSQSQGLVTSITVNTGDVLPEGYIAVKDYSENEGVADWLYSLGMIDSTPTTLISSGFVEIPIYKLTEEGKKILFE